jgi:hypothetical protein
MLVVAGYSSIGIWERYHLDNCCTQKNPWNIESISQPSSCSCAYCICYSDKRPSHRSQVIPYPSTLATLPLASRLFPHQKFLEPTANHVTVCKALLKMWRELQPCATWRSCTALSSPNRHGTQKPSVRHPSSRFHR